MQKYFKPASGSRQDSGALAKKQEAERMAAMQQALRRDQTAAPVMPMSPSSAQQQADDRHAQKAALPHLQSPPRKAAAAAAAPQGRRAVQSSAGRVSWKLLEASAAALELVSDTAAEVAPPRAAQRRSSIPAAAAAAAVADQEEGSERWSEEEPEVIATSSSSITQRAQTALSVLGLPVPGNDTASGKNRCAYLKMLAPKNDRELPPASDEVVDFTELQLLPTGAVTVLAHEDARGWSDELARLLGKACTEAKRLQAGGMSANDITRELKVIAAKLNSKLTGLRLLKVTVMDQTRGLPVPKSNMEAVLEALRSKPSVVGCMLALEHGKTVLTPHLQVWKQAAPKVPAYARRRLWARRFGTGAL